MFLGCDFMATIRINKGNRKENGLVSLVPKHSFFLFVSYFFKSSVVFFCIAGRHVCFRVVTSANLPAHPTHTHRITVSNVGRFVGNTFVCYSNVSFTIIQIACGLRN